MIVQSQQYPIFTGDNAAEMQRMYAMLGPTNRADVDEKLKTFPPELHYDLIRNAYIYDSESLEPARIIHKAKLEAAEFRRTVTVSYYVNMGIEATRRHSGMGNAWRLWVIGKAYDARGLGMVRRKELRAFALSLGLKPRTWQRWIIEARAQGFITDIQKGREWWIILPGASKIAALMGCEFVGRKVTVHASDLIGNGWKARVFTTWESGKQISRERIQKTINVPVRTQTYRAGQMGIEYQRTRNYSKSELSADKIQIIKELSKHKAPFISRGVIYWRLPDFRQSDNVLYSAKGRARKVNLSIRQQAKNQEGLSNVRRALTADSSRDWVRLFNQTEAQRKQSEKRLAKQDRRVTDLYQYHHASQGGAHVWTHCPQA